MSIEKYFLEDGADVYYEDSFRQAIEDHLTYIREHPTTERYTLLPKDVDRFTGNLFGYLVDIKKPTYMHWIIMRVSGLTDPTDFGINNTLLLVPNIKVIDDIRQRSLV